MAFGPKVCAACGSCEEVQVHHLVPRVHDGTDLPTVWLCNHCHSVTVHRRKLVMHHSALTKVGLEKARARGVRLGNPRLQGGTREMAAANDERARDAVQRAAAILPHIAEAQAAGATSLRQVAAVLNARGVRAPAGGQVWTATQVARIIARAARGKRSLP